MAATHRGDLSDGGVLHEGGGVLEQCRVEVVASQVVRRPRVGGVTWEEGSGTCKFFCSRQARVNTPRHSKHRQVAKQVRDEKKNRNKTNDELKPTANRVLFNANTQLAQGKLMKFNLCLSRKLLEKSPHNNTANAELRCRFDGVNKILVVNKTQS